MPARRLRPARAPRSPSASATRACDSSRSTTESPSPFAASLLFGYVGAFMYEGDAPLAERRAAALSLDPALLAELLGTVELRELLDPEVVAEIERDAAARSIPNGVARGVEGVADLLRDLGPLTADEVAARVDTETDARGRARRTRARRAAPPRVRFAGRAVVRRGRRRSAGCATRSACRSRRGCPTCSASPCATRSATSSRASRARTARSRREAVAERFGIGPAVAPSRSRRLGAERRVVEGEFRPHGSRHRVVRRRGAPAASAAARSRRSATRSSRSSRASSRDSCRTGSTSAAACSGVDGVAAVVEQLEGARIPALGLGVLRAARARRRLPAGDARRAHRIGRGALGRVRFARGRRRLGQPSPRRHGRAHAAAARPSRRSIRSSPSCIAVLGGGGGFFFRQLADAVGAEDDAPVVDALWRLVWAGLVTNDTFAPVRGLLTGGGAHRTAAPTPRARLRPGSLSRRSIAASVQADRTARARANPPRAAGRWSVLPLASTSATPRAHALGETLLERYGVVTRGSVVAEGVVGGFALAYRTLSGFEDSGRVRRGYFIDGQGGAQFADRAPPSTGCARRRKGQALALAATDPANPFGAALDWPDPIAERRTPAGAQGRARSSRSSTARPRSTSSAAGARRSSSPTTPRCSPPRLPRSPRRSPAGAPSACASSRSTAQPCSARVLDRPLRAPVSARRRGDCASMPEGDTVYRAARSLDAALAGRTVDAHRLPRAGVRRRSTSPASRCTRWRAAASTCSCASATACVHSHLKMEGEWRLFAAGERWRRPGWQARAIIEMPDVAGRRLRPRHPRGVPGGRGGRLGSATSAPTCSAPTGTPTRRCAASARRPTRRSRSRSASSATSPGSATSTSTSCASSAASCRPGRSARSTSRRSCDSRAASSVPIATAPCARPPATRIAGGSSGSTAAAASRAGVAARASSTAASVATSSSCARPGGARTASV